MIKRTLIFLFFITFANSSLAVRNLTPEITQQQQQLLGIVLKDLDLHQIAQNIWENLIDGKLLQEIKAFKKQHPIPFTIIEKGSTWVSLKKGLDVKMVKPIPGTDYSWEKFRDMDKTFNETTVNKALGQLGLGPVNWGAEGTLGYNSDIDNVAMGQFPLQEAIAKMLADTLHIYMYGKTSDITFDEQIYTYHPGATLQTMRNITSPEAIEKYRKIAFSLAQLQIYRNLRNSHTLPWSRYKKEFIQIFPDVEDVLNSVQQYDQELEKALAQDRNTVKEKLGLPTPPSLDEIKALTELKAIAILSRQILNHELHQNQLAESIHREQQKQPTEKNADEDFKRIIAAANKEKDDLLIQTALLFALSETYYPEGYYTQEAFQLIVLGDQPISQMLTNKVNAYMKQGNPKNFKTIEELRAYMVQVHKDELFATTPFGHMIAMGEQLGYFVHKIESHGEITSQNFFKGAKYLYRFAFSFQKILDYLNEHKQSLGSDYENEYPELSQEFASRLNNIAEVLYTFSRGKVYISQERLINELTQFIKTASPETQAETLAKKASDYIISKTSKEVLTPAQQEQALTHIFSDEKLNRALNVKVTPTGIVTSFEPLTLSLNALLGKTRTDSAIIKKSYDQELSKAFQALDLTHSGEIELLFNKIVKAYMVAVKLFFSLPENRFDPYSLNYNEIHLGHTFNPRNLIPEK